MSIVLSCPFILAGLVCLFVGLLLGVRALFVIRQSKGRVRGNGHAIVAIVISVVMLLGIPVWLTSVRLENRLDGSSPPVPGSAGRRFPGRAKTAAGHGPRCGEINAAQSLSSDMYKSDALEPIAESQDLTTHEQMHLVDVVIDGIASDIYRRDVLVLLAKNPALTPEARAYLFENLEGMNSDMFRSEVFEALREKPPARSD